MDDHHLGENFLTCIQCDGRMRPHIVWFGEMPMQTQIKILRTTKINIPI